LRFLFRAISSDQPLFEGIERDSVGIHGIKRCGKYEKIQKIFLLAGSPGIRGTAWPHPDRAGTTTTETSGRLETTPREILPLSSPRLPIRHPTKT